MPFGIDDRFQSGDKFRQQIFLFGAPVDDAVALAAPQVQVETVDA